MGGKIKGAGPADAPGGTGDQGGFGFDRDHGGNFTRPERSSKVPCSRKRASVPVSQAFW
jgi:hypothetical protein